MGAGASVATGDEEPVKSYHLKQLPDAIEESVYSVEKWPIVIDPSEQASRFLKYQMGSFIRYDDPQHCNAQYLNRALVGALRYGRTLTLKVNSLEEVDRAKLFGDQGMFPEAVCNRSEFFKDEVWTSILTEEDPEPGEISISPEFLFVICSTNDYIPDELKGIMHPIKITDKAEATAEGDEDPEKSGMDGIAAMMGAKEIIRNSTDLVEAAFDGDLEELKSWLEKGFHIESSDGRKHTALSESACQGHIHVAEFLLEQGADPNALADNGRSPLWRASFGGHIEMVTLLLEAGGDPASRDKVSMESAYDVSRNDEIRDVFNNWDPNKTENLKKKRKAQIIAKLEERIKTAADREYYAKQKIREEIIEKAEAGDVEGVKFILEMCAQEAESTESKPRCTAEVRNEQGLSLLAIAAKNDFVELAEFLLTHYKKVDEDRWDLAEGEMSIEAKTFKVNVNTRDLKGWNCVCIAVFHTSLKVLKILLENGGDCRMRSMYNKNAHDLAKDELDAAENVVTSRAEIRQVIEEFDTTSDNAKSRLFGTSSHSPKKTGDDVDYSDLGPDGSPVVMQLEMNKEKDAVGDKKEGKKKDVGGKKAAASTKKKGGSKKK